jgi:hypothetical protein
VALYKPLPQGVQTGGAVAVPGVVIEFPLSQMGYAVQVAASVVLL